MFEFLQTYWKDDWEHPLGSILGSMSICELQNGERAPMDQAILSEWIEAIGRVRDAEARTEGFRGADLRLYGTQITERDC